MLRAILKIWYALIGIKVIQFGTRAECSDDPRFRYKLEASFSRADFMLIARLTTNQDKEKVIVRSHRRWILEQFAKYKQIPEHPRLLEYSITDTKA